MSFANPQWLLTATQVGDEWAQIQKRLRAVLRRIRGDGLRPEMAWAVECDPWNAGHHLHALGWGGLPEPTRLREHALAVGWGRQSDVQEVTSSAVSGYLTKQAVNAGAQLEHFLDMNGGRLLHTTAGFWRSPDGFPIRGGLRAVLQHAEVSR